MRHRSKISSVRLVRETTVPLVDAPTHVRSPQDVARLMSPLAAIELGEVLWVLALNTQHRLLGGPIVVTRGLVNQSPVHAREVFRAAIAAGAVEVVLVHNHPSGASRSSEAESCWLALRGVCRVAREAGVRTRSRIASEALSTMWGTAPYGRPPASQNVAMATKEIAA